MAASSSLCLSVVDNLAVVVEAGAVAVSAVAFRFVTENLVGELEFVILTKVMKRAVKKERESRLAHE